MDAKFHFRLLRPTVVRLDQKGRMRSNLDLHAKLDMSKNRARETSLSMNSNSYIRSPSFLHLISLRMKVAKAFDVSTGSSNRKGAKFGGGSAVRADWLCIGSEMSNVS